MTWPEPIDQKHPFLTLPNVLLFPHIAGYAAAEVLSMPDCTLEELVRWQKGEPLRYEVTIGRMRKQCRDISSCDMLIMKIFRTKAIADSLKNPTRIFEKRVKPAWRYCA